MNVEIQTKAQKHRAQAELKKTEEMLKKFKRGNYQFWDMELIEAYEAHREKLQKMLDNVA